jgi:hypothetical protein
MREGTAGVRSSMLGPPAVYNTAGQGENHTFSQKRHPADVRPAAPKFVRLAPRAPHFPNKIRRRTSVGGRKIS